ncbi:MAG: Zn-ribbon domain-containing OB-fold protein [Methanoculleaceae archaeon]
MSVARFWRKIPHRYNLEGTRCERCGGYFFPPRSFCPVCRRDGKIVRYRFRGEGTVVTYTTIRTASDQFEGTTPYVIGIVKLDEGPCLTAQITCNPGEISIGDRVRAVFRKINSDGKSGVIHYGTKFEPVGRTTS